MKPPRRMKKMFGRTLYSVAASTMIASDNYEEDGRTDRDGRNTFLYMTRDGEYFIIVLTQNIGERDTLEVVSKKAAKGMYSGSLSRHYISYQLAFPE